MVVQSIALPNVSGSSRDHELALVSAEVAAPEGRSFYVHALIPLIVATQAAWLAVLGYVAYRVLI